jgi:hypothetical protein
MIRLALHYTPSRPLTLLALLTLLGACGSPSGLSNGDTDGGGSGGGTGGGNGGGTGGGSGGGSGGGNGGGTGGAAEWLVEDFSTYSSTPDMLADPRGVYTESEDEGTDRIFLDQTTGHGSSSQSMRYDYIAPGCNSVTVRRNLTLPHSVKELWAEVHVRFSPNFTTRNSAGCTTPPDFKFFFGRMTQTSRFEVKWGTGWDNPPLQIAIGAPANEDIITGHDAAQYWDNEWHQLRVHWKVGAPNGLNTVVEVWIDGAKIYERFDFNGQVDQSVWSVMLGANLDQGIPSGTMSLWWGRISLWNADPGW